MATLEEFKALRAGVAPEVQKELYGLMSSDPEAGKQRMVEIAAGQGVTLTTEEVRGFLLQMDEESEFDDIELDPIALTAIAGGQGNAVGGELTMTTLNDFKLSEPYVYCRGAKEAADLVQLRPCYR